MAFGAAAAVRNRSDDILKQHSSHLFNSASPVAAKGIFAPQRPDQLDLGKARHAWSRAIAWSLRNQRPKAQVFEDTHHRLEAVPVQFGQSGDARDLGQRGSIGVPSRMIT